MQTSELFHADPGPLDRHSREMVDVVPAEQILEHENEIAVAASHLGDIHVRCPQGRGTRGIPIEVDLTLVPAEHPHRPAGVGLGGQFDDDARRDAVSGQVCAVQLGREATVEGDLFGPDVGDDRGVGDRVIGTQDGSHPVGGDVADGAWNRRTGIGEAT